MGRLTTEGGAAVFRGMNYNATGLPVPDFETLMLGRANSSCKECLPLQLTTGSLVKYLGSKKDDEMLTYFMPTSTGSCRFTDLLSSPLPVRYLTSEASCRNWMYLILSAMFFIFRFPIG